MRLSSVAKEVLSNHHKTKKRFPDVTVRPQWLSVRINIGQGWPSLRASASDQTLACTVALSARLLFFAFRISQSVAGASPASLRVPAAPKCRWIRERARFGACEAGIFGPTGANCHANIY